MAALHTMNPCLVSLAMLFPALLRPPVVGALAAMGLSAFATGAALQPVGATSLFQTAELNVENFVLVAAPIGDGTRAQLNIYEQLNDRRACFAVNGGQPAAVDPLLATFDFTGICGRYLDANGYSLRIGGSDLASAYRLSVVRVNGDNLLLAVPTRSDAGPEMVVARTQGAGTGYLQLVLEPGWQLKRRAYNGRNLGHVYLYRDSWPGALDTVADGAGSDGAGSSDEPAAVQLGSESLPGAPGAPGL
jgi:hypothetical protein